MNVKATRDFFEANGIIAIRADKGVSKTANQIDDLLEDLGNETRAIPYYAIYPPGGGEPQVLEGLILSKNVIETYKKAVQDTGGSEAQQGTLSETEGSESSSGTKKVASRE